MHPSLASAFQRLEAQRHALMEELKPLTNAQFQHKPGPDVWSLAEVLSHILAAERLSIQYMEKKMQGIGKLKDSGILEDGKFLILQLSQRLPGLKFKAPKQVVQSTPQYSDWNAVSAEWSLLRTRLASLLDTIPETQVKRMVYRHVIAGYLDARHAVLFLGEHIRHHQPQINRLKQLPL